MSTAFTPSQSEIDAEMIRGWGYETAARRLIERHAAETARLTAITTGFECNREAKKKAIAAIEGLLHQLCDIRNRWAVVSALPDTEAKRSNLATAALDAFVAGRGDLARPHITALMEGAALAPFIPAYAANLEAEAARIVKEIRERAKADQIEMPALVEAMQAETAKIPSSRFNESVGRGFLADVI